MNHTTMEEKTKELEEQLLKALDQRDQYAKTANERTAQLNDMKVKERKIMAEVKNMMAFIGFKPGQPFDVSKLDFGKIIGDMMDGKSGLNFNELIKMVEDYEKTALHVIK